MSLFIGDVHGKFSRYRNLIRGVPPTIQVGDMGVGFRRTQGPRVGEFTQNPPHLVMSSGNHRFIRGNHDNPAECGKHSQWIADGTVEDGMMFVGGAQSIDKEWRTEDYSWWKDEELSPADLDSIRSVYASVRPHTMVTHDCPEEVAEALATHVGKAKLAFCSRTRWAFQDMWHTHSPKLWVFGHWHHSFDHVLRGTRFVCLAELGMRELSHVQIG